MSRLPPRVEALFDFGIVPGIRQAMIRDDGPDSRDIGIETPSGGDWMTVGTDLSPGGLESGQVTP